MKFVPPGNLTRCAAVVLIVGLLVACKLFFKPLAGDQNPFLFFLAGIMLSSWLGGMWLGLLATVLTAVLGDMLFLSPGEILHRNSWPANFQLGLFVAEGTVVSWGIATLRRTLIALREADRRKDDFLATLAHELRNHLAPIQYALAAVGQSPGQTTTLAERARGLVESQIRQMVHLVDDLSDLSRIRSGKISLRLEDVTLFSLVESAVETSRPLIDRMGHELTVTLPGKSVTLTADRARLVQALVNLLNNAAKYTGRNGRIALTAERANDEVLIRVCDTGAGIPADQLARVFDRFIQLNHTLDHSEGGSGIGLALVRQIVERHGGAVEASSEGEGKGSQFVVRLPLLKASSTTDADTGP